MRRAMATARMDVSSFVGRCSRKTTSTCCVKEFGCSVMSRGENLPTYRVPTLVRAPGDQVDL
jgi:hypothetical protein